jgi:hypothetical protein
MLLIRSCYILKTLYLVELCGEWIMQSLLELDITTVVLNDLHAEFGMAPAVETVKAKCITASFPKLFTFREVESLFLLLQCHTPSGELLLHFLVYH